MKSILTVITLIVLCFQLRAQKPGTLDYSFGDSGKVSSTIFQGDLNASLLQSDGKIVLGGYEYNKSNAFLARYNKDGSPDISFGDKGGAVYYYPDSVKSEVISSLAQQKDGKIVAAGSQIGNSRSHIAVMRYNEDGSIDRSFGTEGITGTKIASDDYLRDMALLPDGRIAVTGNVNNSANDNNRIFLALYTSDGKLDKTFGDTGIIIYDAGIPINAFAIAITREDKIIVGGYYRFDDKTFLLRYNPDGTLDKSFGTGGMASMTFDRSIAGPSLRDIAIGSDNTIATAGRASLDNIDQAILVSRFTENGTPDSSFGTNGYTAERFVDGDVYVYAVAVQTNGKVVTGGYTEENDRSFFTLARFDRDGILDSSFGKNGIQNTSFLAHDQGRSLLIQNDGRIVLSGNTYTYLEDKFPVVLARYNGDDNRKQIIVTKIKRWIQHHGISWQADNNVRYYNVQRSNDGGITYQPVAKFYNSKTFYNYEDAAQTANTCYRVAITAKDGGRLVSNTVFINEGSQASIYPNPVHGTLQLQSLPTDSKTSISIVDFNGNVRTTATASGGSISVNTSSLKPGNYLLRLQHNNNITTQTFVKE